MKKNKKMSLTILNIKSNFWCNKRKTKKILGKEKTVAMKLTWKNFLLWKKEVKFYFIKIQGTRGKLRLQTNRLKNLAIIWKNWKKNSAFDSFVNYLNSFFINALYRFWSKSYNYIYKIIIHESSCGTYCYIGPRKLRQH